MFFTLFGYWAGGGGGQTGLVHNLLMQFFTLGSSKIEVFETYIFDILITQNHHPSCEKHILACIYIVFTPFRVCVAGGRFFDSLRGGLAEGNRITSQRLLDQSQAGVYRGKRHIPPILVLYAYPTPRG